MTQLRSGGLSKDSEQRLKRGEALSHLLTQYKNCPISVPEQVFCLIALSNGLLDGLSGDAVKKYRAEILEFMKVEEGEVLADLMGTKKLAAGSKEKFLEAIKKYFANQPKAE